jgi:hypothetical protein
VGRKACGYVEKRSGESLRIAPRNYGAALPYNERRVADVRNDTWKAARHGLGNGIGETFAERRRRNRYVEGVER